MATNCPICKEVATYDIGTEEIASAHFCGECMIWKNVSEYRWQNGMEEYWNATYQCWEGE